MSWPQNRRLNCDLIGAVGEVWFAVMGVFRQLELEQPKPKSNELVRNVVGNIFAGQHIEDRAIGLPS